MALTPQLQQRLTQRHSLTPQLRQAIKILQLNNIELNEFIEQESAQNPLLELEIPSALGSHISSVPATQRQFEKMANSRPIKEIFPKIHTTPSQTLPTVDASAGISNKHLLRHGAIHFRPAINDPIGTAFDIGKMDFISRENDLGEEKGLKEHLREQLMFTHMGQTMRKIALYMIDLVDDTGYLSENLLSIAVELKVQPSLVEKALSALQTLDPPGVFARNIKECLRLQVNRVKGLTPAIAAVLDNLDLLAANNFSALIKLSNLSKGQITEAVHAIKRLHPKPGLTFQQSVPIPMVPDVYTWCKEDGTWTFQLNNQTLPNVKLDFDYHSHCKKLASTEDEKKYLSQQFKGAQWLMRSLDQRTTTILDVTREIVAQQKGFLTQGIVHINPLTLRDVGNNICMHESTVSRAISGKYISTPKGTFSFKYFFSSAINSRNTKEQHSGTKVRYLIKQLIEKENPERILSDSQILGALENQGIIIARRTITKYREVLGIPSSIQRRRQKTGA